MLSKKKLIMGFDCKIPGEIYISSKYFKNGETYVIKIVNEPLKLTETFVEVKQQDFAYGANSKIKIIPRDKYQKLMSYVEESDVNKFQATIKLANGTVIKAEKGEFNSKEKSIIFTPFVNFMGEASIEVKYEDTIISCANCSVNVIFIDIDLNRTVAEYSKSIKLGESSNITIHLKDNYGNGLSEEMLEKVEVKCLFYGESIDINSTINKNNSMIEAYNTEMITRPGILTWSITYAYKVLNYTVTITAEAFLKNLKLSLISDSLSEEVKENNTDLTLDVNQDFNLTYEFVDLFYNKLEKKDSAEITEAQMNGNDMTPIKFNITREENIFNLSIPQDKKEDYNYLVSGTNYQIIIQVKKGKETAYFKFPVNLTYSGNDAGYGNGPYNISHFTIEPSSNIFKMTAGDKYVFYLNVKTKKDLLYHRKLDINEHLKFYQTFDDQTFTFKASNINSTLGIFLIELFSTKQNDDAYLVMTFDGEEIKKNISLAIQSARTPNPNTTEIVYYTNMITEDIEPIKVYLTMQDIYKNIMNRIDITYKKNLFIMLGDEKPEQNIEFDASNKTYILSFVSDYHNSSFNLSVYFNDSNNLMLMKNDLVVQLKVEKFLEPEPLVAKIAYKSGIVFLYENKKIVNATFKIDDDNTPDSNQDLEVKGDFLLYIRDIKYEKGENDTKKAVYSGYFAIVKLSIRNSTDPNERYFVYDKKLISVFEQMKNGSYSASDKSLNEEIKDTCSFIKIDFYENGKIKRKQYPKIDNFYFRGMEYLNEAAELIIPKISSDLFSEDIQEKIKELQKGILETDSVEIKRTTLLRRLSELNPNPMKKKRNDKIKKIRFRVLQEALDVLHNDTYNTTDNETIIEDEIIPTEKEFDLKLREITNNGDNSSNITLLSLEDVDNDQAKLTGSLDNKTVVTNVDQNGKVMGITQNQKTQFVTGVRDPSQDEYIYNNAYTEESYFEKDDFIAENESKFINDENPIKLKSVDADNSNIVNLLDDFADDN